jgi:hypothetical protein
VKLRDGFFILRNCAKTVVERSFLHILNGLKSNFIKNVEFIKEIVMADDEFCCFVLKMV